MGTRRGGEVPRFVADRRGFLRAHSRAIRLSPRQCVSRFRRDARRSPSNSIDGFHHLSRLEGIRAKHRRSSEEHRPRPSRSRHRNLVRRRARCAAGSCARRLRSRPQPQRDRRVLRLGARSRGVGLVPGLRRRHQLRRGGRRDGSRGRACELGRKLHRARVGHGARVHAAADRGVESRAAGRDRSDRPPMARADDRNASDRDAPRAAGNIPDGLLAVAAVWLRGRRESCPRGDAHERLLPRSLRGHPGAVDGGDRVESIPLQRSELSELGQPSR